MTSCFLIDRKLQDLDVKQSGEEVFLLIRLAAIDSVRETFDDDGKLSHSECMIYYRSGDTLLIGMGPKKLTLLLEEYGYL